MASTSQANTPDRMRAPAREGASARVKTAGDRILHTRVCLAVDLRPSTLWLAFALAACTPAPPETAPAGPAAPAAPPSPEPAKPEPAKPEPAKAEPAKPTPMPVVAKPQEEAKAPVDDLRADGEPPPAPAGPPPPEIAIQPWSIDAHAPTWTLRDEPSEPVAFVVELHAGVLGRAGSRWVQLGADGKLVDAPMDVEPRPPLMGVWPSDAWFVDYRSKMEDDFEYHEIRLMKLRGGDRWVPQKYNGEQWFHPGTDDEVDGHASTLSGMLVYSPSLTGGVDRIAGRHEAPLLGTHRGAPVDFLETGKAEVYVLSRDDAGTYAVTQCWDDPCAVMQTRKLPLSSWKFGRKVARGKHAVSVVATSGEREFILHYRGKPGWLLDELPAGERPTSMWASEEGGLWTLTGEKLRWRDTESAWHDVALPEGLATPSVALSEDRKRIWLSGVVGGAAKIFSTEANAAAPAAKSTP
jgi:hypothetical protein